MFAAVTRADLFSFRNPYCALGRGIPDVSAHWQVLRFQIFCKGEPRLFQGTSCSAPVRLCVVHSQAPQLTTIVQTVASIISLLNDILISVKKPPLGWLNPWLYGKGRDGDITGKAGSNPGCNTNGFSAITGWDPV